MRSFYICSKYFANNVVIYDTISKSDYQKEHIQRRNNMWYIKPREYLKHSTIMCPKTELNHDGIMENFLKVIHKFQTVTIYYRYHKYSHSSAL